MPNWCQNRVGLFHASSFQLQRIRNLNGKSLFSEFRPVTTNVDRSNGGVMCDVQTKLWGTKWDVNFKIETNGEDHLVLTFDSAWSPPIDFYKFLEDLGFIVRATYYEAGMGFAGSYHDGIDEEYSSNSDEFESIKSEFENYF